MSVVPEIQPLFLTSAQDISGTNNGITVNLPYPLKTQDNYIALAKGFFFYSNPNVAPQYHNQSYTYTWIDGNTYTVTMPTGNYQFSDMNGFLDLIMVEHGDYLIDQDGNNVYYITLISNPVYYAITLTVNPVPTSLPAGWSVPSNATWSFPGTPTTPQITFPALPAGAVYGTSTMFGFTPGTYPPTPIATEYQFNSQTAPQISAVINFNLTCNLVSANQYNANAQILYTLYPDVAYGSLQTVEPVQLTYLKVADGSYNQVSLALLDQNNQPLPMLDGTQSWYLYIVKGRPNTAVGGANLSQLQGRGLSR
jgi:hypothetical protein